MKLRNRTPIFDEAPDLSETGNLKLSEGLSDAEYDDALLLAPYTKGLMIVTGDPGSGKDLFGNTFSYKMKRYFGKEVLRDEPPRRAFGDYIPFDMSTINEDLDDMEDAKAELEELSDDSYSGNKKKTKRSRIGRMTNIAKEWIKRYGEKVLRNKALYIVEFSGWMSNRNPMAPINIFMGQILRRWRHFDLLVIGTTQIKKELDKSTCLPWLSHEVRCTWMGNNTGKYRIFGVRSVTSTGVINVSRNPFTYKINGETPRNPLQVIKITDSGLKLLHGDRMSQNNKDVLTRIATEYLTPDMVDIKYLTDAINAGIVEIKTERYFDLFNSKSNG